MGWYLAGFVDGEGSFNVSLRKKSDYKVGWQPVLSFNVSQRERTILALMKRHFGCGIIKVRKDGLHSYDVTNPIAIQEKIIPFFKKYRFLSASKKKNFSIFIKIVKLMSDKRHLNPDGFEELLQLRKKLNKGKGRKRKYT
ncbi:MAG: LAGLIDADG family homing endonuclease, partial [Nitrospinales bacterium]